MPLINTFAYIDSLPHPFGFFLKYSKGMRVVPRALKLLTPDQLIGLFNAMLLRLECVEIANVAVNLDKEEVLLIHSSHKERWMCS
jgi:hypothetical protein